MHICAMAKSQIVRLVLLHDIIWGVDEGGEEDKGSRLLEIDHAGKV